MHFYPLQPHRLHLALYSFIQALLNSTRPMRSPLFCCVYGFPFVSFHLQCAERASNAPSPSGGIKVERVTCSHSNPVIQLLWPWPQWKHTPVPSPPVQITPKPHYYQTLAEIRYTTPNVCFRSPFITGSYLAFEISQQKPNTNNGLVRTKNLFFFNSIMTLEQQLFMVMFLQPKIQWFELNHHKWQCFIKWNTCKYMLVFQ